MPHTGQLTSFADVVPYATPGVADAYFASKLGKTAIWGLLTAAEKTAALREATLDIDELNYIGETVVTNQVRKWPRYLSVSANAETMGWLEDDTFPTQVGLACCEQAFYIAKNYKTGYDPDSRRDHQDQGLSSISRAGASESYDMLKARRHKLCLDALRLLRSYIQKTGNLNESGV